MWDYSDEDILETANAAGEIGAIACGDDLKFMMRIDPKSETITAAKFLTFGCGSAVTPYSAFAELIAGKTVDEAFEIANQDITGFLGALPSQDMHLAVDRLPLARGLDLMNEFFRAVKGAFKETPGLSRLVLVKASSRRLRDGGDTHDEEFG
ncbi:iron-sulfur cluster assembly scaffold protein [Mesorhizobium calcicola]|uniref:Iron-sulfur cluster assembly scaffold protein n=1 Tax=Mesorhizobium calcicola TaxID=1300310 RepID=A0ABW4W9J7_9HYPH